MFKQNEQQQLLNIRHKRTHIISEHNSQFPDLVFHVNGVQSEIKCIIIQTYKEKKIGSKCLPKIRPLATTVCLSKEPICNMAWLQNVLFSLK